VRLAHRRTLRIMDVEQIEDGVACTPHATATWALGLPETLTPAIKKKAA
jgi:hypothetical protein